MAGMGRKGQERAEKKRKGQKRRGKGKKGREKEREGKERKEVDSGRKVENQDLACPIYDSL